MTTNDILLIILFALFTVLEIYFLILTFTGWRK